MVTAAAGANGGHMDLLRRLSITTAATEAAAESSSEVSASVARSGTCRQLVSVSMTLTAGEAPRRLGLTHHRA